MTSPVSNGDRTQIPGHLLTGSPYAVKLPVFEGPLDLLLHLIRLNEVEITDIPIARVAEQYIEYIELMHELDLDIVGEYLLMAATLAWIKSRMLLPPDGEDDEGDEDDPRAELVARLLEYQRFKEAAGELGERRLLGRDVFLARARVPRRPRQGSGRSRSACSSCSKRFARRSTPPSTPAPFMRSRSRRSPSTSGCSR